MSSVRRLTRGLVEVALKREHERAVDLPPEVLRKQPSRLRPGGGEFPAGGRPDPKAAPELDRPSRGQPDERSVLIERGAVRATVLCEGNRDVCASLDLGPQLEERAQAESTQGAEEVGRAGRR